MAPVPLILMAFAFVCFVVAAVFSAVVEPYRTRFIAGGLALWSFVVILGYAGVFGK